MEREAAEIGVSRVDSAQVGVAGRISADYLLNNLQKEH